MRDRKTILVDCDDQTNYISEMLTDCGCDVTTARSGDVQELIRSRRYDLFITHMYGMDAIEVLNSIKTDDPEMDVVILSGEMRYCFESLAETIVEYLNGPLNGNRRVLTDSVSRAIARHGGGLGDPVRYGIAIRPIKR